MGPKKGGKGPSENTDKWQILYPAYLNSNLKAKQGRRVPLAKSVANPTIDELSDVCKHLKFQVDLELNKAYSRDYMQRGRLRVLIRKEGKPVNPDIPNKRALLYKLGELVPKLAARVKKAQQDAQVAAREAAQAEQQAQQASGGGGGGSKKKSRRKR